MPCKNSGRVIVGQSKIQNIMILEQISKYHIYSAIRWGYPPSRVTRNYKSVLCSFTIIHVLPFLNNPKDIDPFYKMDLDFWDCFGRTKTLSFN